jgi:hypothetical protein
MKRFSSQWLVCAVVVLVVTGPAWTQRPPVPPPKGTRMQGQVVRIPGPNQCALSREVGRGRPAVVHRRAVGY